MSTETLMTSDADNTNASVAASQPTAEPSVTEAPASGQSQQSAAPAPAAEGQPGESQQTDAAKPEGAPESYEFANAEAVDAQVLGQFSELAKELGMTQDAAQKVLDKMGPAIQARQAEQLQAVRQQWEADARADKEFGGEHLDKNLSAAKKAMDAFATPELRSLLSESGLGNHPEVIRFMVRTGKALGEDTFVSGGRTTNQPADPAKRLFPNQA